MIDRQVISPVGEYKFTIDAYLSDFRGKATLPMLCGFMLQAATKHAEERGFGYSHMTQQKRVWVLTRMCVEIEEYPSNNSDIVVATWLNGINRLFAERFFSFCDGNGRFIGFAKSLWAAIDLDTRRPMNVQELSGLSDYVFPERACPIDNIARLPQFKNDCEIAEEFTVKYSDLDINKHLNSMKYIEHFVDAFDVDMFRCRDINRIDINYLAEGHSKDVITIARKQQDENVYFLEMDCRGTALCSARLEWI